MFIVGSGGAVASNGKYYNNFLEIVNEVTNSMTANWGISDKNGKGHYKVLDIGVNYWIDINLTLSENTQDRCGLYLYETSVEEKGGGYYLPGQTWGIANVLSIKEVVYPAMLKKGFTLNSSYNYTPKGGRNSFNLMPINPYANYGEVLNPEFRGRVVYKIFWD